MSLGAHVPYDTLAQKSNRQLLIDMLQFTYFVLLSSFEMQWAERSGAGEPPMLSSNTQRDVGTQGLLASLELLPLFSGVDPDLELFASGCVQDDGGDWQGGVSLEDTPIVPAAAAIAAAGALAGADSAAALIT